MFKIKEFISIKYLFQKVFSGSSDCKIKLRELESGKFIKSFVGHNNSIVCIKNVLGEKLISGDASGLIKIETGECLRTIDAHIAAVETILLISNDIFATCSYDETIKLFDLNT